MRPLVACLSKNQLDDAVWIECGKYGFESFDLVE